MDIAGSDGAHWRSNGPDAGVFDAIHEPTGRSIEPFVGSNSGRIRVSTRESWVARTSFCKGVFLVGVFENNTFFEEFPQARG